MSRGSAVPALVAAAVIVAVPVVPADAREGIAASITFCSKVGKSSGKLYGVADTFALKEGAKVWGVVDLDGFQPGEDLVLHLLWIKPNGKRAFAKRVVVAPDGPKARVQTALSLSPERRDPGRYRLKVYLFRMLFLEKEVELLLQEAES